MGKSQPSHRGDFSAIINRQQPTQGTGPSSTIWGRGPKTNGFSTIIKSPGCKSLVATKNFPSSSLLCIYKKKKFAATTCAVFFAVLPRKPYIMFCVVSNVIFDGLCYNRRPICKPSTLNQPVVCTRRTRYPPLFFVQLLFHS